RDEAITLFLAGHETTANALTFTFHLLSRHPEIQRKLWEEIDAVTTPAGEGFSTEHVAALPYTRAVFSESMRLFSPAWTVARDPPLRPTITLRPRKGLPIRVQRRAPI